MSHQVDDYIAALVRDGLEQTTQIRTLKDRVEAFESAARLMISGRGTWQREDLGYEALSKLLTDKSGEGGT